MKRILLAVAALTLVTSSTVFGAAGNLELTDAMPDLVYDPGTGSVELVPGTTGSKKLVGFTLGNAAGEIKPVADLGAVLPWQVVLGDNTSKQIGSSDLTFVGTESPINLGTIFPTGFDKASLHEWLSLANATTGLGAAGRATFDLIVVPEPASFLLGLLGMVGVVGIRRKGR